MQKSPAIDEAILDSVGDGHMSFRGQIPPTTTWLTGKEVACEVKV